MRRMPCLPAPTGCEPTGHEAERWHDATVFLSPRSESVESPEFEVGHGRAIVRGFDLVAGAIRVDMVHGHAETKRYAPVIQHAQPWMLTPTHTLLVIDIPGRYRLVATEIALGPHMPTVVVTELPAGRATL